MSMRAVLGGTLLALLVPLGAGCSSADDPAAAPEDELSSPVPVAEAEIRRELAQLFSGDHSSRTARREGRCFVDALLDRTDAPALAEAGVIGDDGHVAATLPVLETPLAEDWVDAQAECTDFVEASTEALTAQSKGKLDGRRYARCLDRSLSPEQIRTALVRALTGGMQGTEVATLSDAQATCAGAALPAD